jgi:hypothetical protein
MEKLWALSTNAVLYPCTRYLKLYYIDSHTDPLLVHLRCQYSLASLPLGRQMPPHVTSGEPRLTGSALVSDPTPRLFHNPGHGFLPLHCSCFGVNSNY